MEVNQIELQNIRHLGGHSCGFSEKLNYFTTITQDQNILDVMNRIINSCNNLKQDLLTYVGGTENE